jgi:hypothetical protein
MAIQESNRTIVVIVGLAVVAGGAFWWWTRGRTPPPAPRPPVAAPVLPTVPDARVEPQIQHPIEKVATRPSRPLPGLDESDKDMRDGLASVFGARRLGELFILDGIIRRIVATIDNLPREQVAPSLWAITPTPGDFLVESRGGSYVPSAKNAARYEPRVRLLETMDTRRLVALYIRHYPLFQKAYQELGYPQGYFNDRLVEVIDHLLATADPPQPILLTRPRTRYEFVDQDLQRRSAGQKVLARVGPQEAARIKAVLTDIRRQVTGQNLR